jgi:ribosomal protein S18 acetylase RimI-like enzyme
MIQLAIEVRPAKVADAEALSGFAARVFPLGGRPGADPAHLAAYIAAELTPKRFRELIADKNAVLLIAESGGRIAGYAALVHACGNSQIQAKSPAELRKLYVDPRYHGGGVADALMRELLRATEAACEAIWLSVYSENARAIAFYTRSGFRLAGEHDFLVGEDRQKDFLMRRDVAKEGTR